LHRTCAFAMKHKVKRVHFVGIGGAGMSGIAEVLLTQGYQVSGSDIATTAVTRRLTALGARIAAGHGADNIAGADVVVVSTAVAHDNPEIAAAREKGVPVVPRALMLAELMRLKQGIAVAGTHGKTTTTSLIASVLAEGGLDPTFVIGGRLVSADANARLGKGEFLVAEADESDASFLVLQPVLAVITNVDADHMETYEHDFAKLKEAFVNFAQRLPFYGTAVLCIDDANVRDIIPAITKSIVTYGFADDAQLRAQDVDHAQGRMRFVASSAKMQLLSVELNLAGVHNVQNALAAIAVGREAGVADGAIAKALSTADALLVADVYPAGEAPIVAADGRALTRALRIGGRIEPVFVEDVSEMPAAIRAIVRDGDVVLTMGAGSIGQVSPLVAA